MQTFETLQEAKDFLKENYKKGVECPCCHQYVKLYGRTINASMAYALILVSQYFDAHTDEEWLHVSNYLSDLKIPAPVKMGGDFVKLRHWGLIESAQGRREDGSKRNGYHRITEKGRRFVKRMASVPSKVFIYNDRVLGVDSKPMTIDDALGKKFNYDNLMANV